MKASESTKGLEGGLKGARRGLEGGLQVETFKGASRGLEGGLKGASRGLQGGFKGASRGLQGEGALQGAWRGLEGGAMVSLYPQQQRGTFFALERHREGVPCWLGVGPALVYGRENEIAAVTFFAKTSTALTNRSAFASPTEWQDPGEHRCWFNVSSPACMLPIFAKALCCLELFGCCCRRLLQRGVGEVLILLRHCWRDAFFCVCASHCSVLFGLLMRCLFLDSPFLRPSRLLTHATRRALCTLAGTWNPD